MTLKLQSSDCARTLAIKRYFTILTHESVKVFIHCTSFFGEHPQNFLVHLMNLSHKLVGLDRSLGLFEQRKVDGKAFTIATRDGALVVRLEPLRKVLGVTAVSTSLTPTEPLLEGLRFHAGWIVQTRSGRRAHVEETKRTAW